MTEMTRTVFFALSLFGGVLAAALMAPEARAQADVHIVQEGDTLESIARRYGSTVSELRWMNNISGTSVRVGQRLVIRQRGAGRVLNAPRDDDEEGLADVGPSLSGVRPPGLVAPEPIPTGPPPPPPPPASINEIDIGPGGARPLPARPAAEGGAATRRHVVSSGETLFSLARRYGTTVDAIRRANNLRDDRIAVGQQLTIPGDGVVRGATLPADRGRFDVRRSVLPDDEIHVVVPGETLFTIASRYGTTAGDLLALNSVTTGPLVPGMILVLPEESRAYHRRPAESRVDEEGLALIYPESYVGRTTISGEPYDPSALTASHRELPFGTMLVVRNPATERETLVRVNDRGPVAEGFLIELSDAAARALGLAAGSAEAVEVMVLR